MQSSLILKVACWVKTNTTWTTKNTTSSHYFSKKFKTNTLQGHKRYMKIFELEINNLRIPVLAAKKRRSFTLKSYLSQAPSFFNFSVQFSV